jgi:hypothetical protein
MSQDWHHYAIYMNPSDYPDKFVVRRWTIQAGNPHPVPDKEPIIVCDSIAEARAKVPPGLVCVGRQPMDDPCILETFI